MNRIRLIAIALMFSLNATPLLAEGSWFGVLITDHTTERGDKAVKILVVHPLSPLAGRLSKGALVFQLGGSGTETIAQFIAAANRIEPGSQINLEFSKPGATSRAGVIVTTLPQPKRFTSPAVCPADKKDPPKTVAFYAISPPKGSNIIPIDAELSWLRASTGCSLPDAVVDSFRKLYKIAFDNKVDYPDLVQHALANGKDEKPKKSAAKSKPATSAANGNPQRKYFTTSDAGTKKKSGTRTKREPAKKKADVANAKTAASNYAGCNKEYINSRKGIAACTLIIGRGAKETNAVRARTLVNRGDGYRFVGDLKSALADHDAAIALKPDYARAYRWRAVAHSKSGNFQQAIADYSKAIELEPKRAELYTFRAHIFKQQEKYAEALADYDKALEIDPYLGVGTMFLVRQTRAQTATKLAQQKAAAAAKKKPAVAAALSMIERISAVLRKRHEKQYVDSYKSFLQKYVRPDNVKLFNTQCNLNTTMTGILTDKYILEEPGAAYEFINQIYKIDRESKTLLKDDLTMRVFSKYCLGKFISEGDDFKSYAVARQILIYRPLDMMDYVLARHVLDVRFVGSDLFAVNEIIKPYFNGKIPEPSDESKKHIFYTAEFLKARTKPKGNRSKVEAPTKEAPPKKPVKKDSAAQKCDGGNATDCYEEGMLHSLGGGSTDKLKALKLYRKACDGGISPACHDVGAMLYNGEGGAANKQEARIFYRKACEGGDVHGCYNIGQMHDKGEGGSADKPKALKFFRKACEGRFLEGCYNAAVMLGSGEGGPVDKSQARKLYRTACEGGHTISCLFWETMKTGDGKEPKIQ